MTISYRNCHFLSSILSVKFPAAWNLISIYNLIKNLWLAFKIFRKIAKNREDTRRYIECQWENMQIVVLYKGHRNYNISASIWDRELDKISIPMVNNMKNSIKSRSNLYSVLCLWKQGITGKKIGWKITISYRSFHFLSTIVIVQFPTAWHLISKNNLKSTSWWAFKTFRKIVRNSKISKYIWKYADYSLVRLAL